MALTRFLVAARLLAPDALVPPPAAREALARACACGDWDEVVAGLSRARATVATAWRDALGEELEIVS
jgi:glutamate-ammonia-ligase adenylyltransferase